jgi:uncharacterized protein YndB with AHSA1/START domain
MSDAAIVVVSRRLSHAPAAVFDAFLDPAIARRFLFVTPDGEMVKAEIDPRVGGQFNFTDRRDGEDVEHVGEYVELDRPRRLVFSFAVPAFSTESTVVALDFAPFGQGSEVTLTHEGVLSDYAERTEEGWGTILETLDKVLAG